MCIAATTWLLSSRWPRPAEHGHPEVIKLASLINVEELDIEGEPRVRGNWATRRARGAVGKSRWDHELALPADLHAGNAHVPPLDDVTSAQGERDVARVEDLAVVELAAVLDLHVRGGGAVRTSVIV